jgi:hypothetical protein
VIDIYTGARRSTRTLGAMKVFPKILASALMLYGVVHSTDSRATEEPQEVTLCQVLDDPAAFNHKLIKISGVVSRGFEDFTLNDKSCHNANTMWLELGGTRGSQVIYCCGDNNVDGRRSAPLTVEGIETNLVEDKVFTRFEHLTSTKRSYAKARVVLIGRYFSGEQQTFPGGTFWMGYGHMGMGSLLVIQQVLVASRQ